MKPARLPIVVIEDDDLDAEQTTDALRRSGVTRTILRLNDGAEAIDYFATLSDARSIATAPAFVLLDLKMPKFDGLDVLRYRSEQPALRLFPVIVFTSSAYEVDIERSAQLGANAYVVKPVDPRAYEATVAATGRFWSEYDRPDALGRDAAGSDYLRLPRPGDLPTTTRVGFTRAGSESP